MRWIALTSLFVAAATVRPVSIQSSSLDVTGLLDRYASGRFDEALRPVSSATEDQARALRVQLMTSGRVWIDAGGPSRTNRMAAAALFTLEAEHINAERGDWAPPNDYTCAGACMIEWACALLRERGELSPAPAASGDAIEHAWFAAGITLASGVRDWPFLHQPRVTAEPFGDSTGHADHALARFAGDVAFRLARALAIASRFEVTTEQDQPREGARLDFPSQPVPTIRVNGITIGQPRTTAATRRSAQRLATLRELTELSSAPTVGAKARARLAYLHWTIGDYAEALTEAEAAAAQASDADDRYLARYIAGLAAQSSGTLTKAESEFASALEARPNSQSAALALAALLFQRGDATGAYALSSDSLTKAKNDDDPWRMFQYGDYATMGAKIQSMRATFKTAAGR